MKVDPSSGSGGIPVVLGSGVPVVGSGEGGGGGGFDGEVETLLEPELLPPSKPPSSSTKMLGPQPSVNSAVVASVQDLSMKLRI